MKRKSIIIILSILMSFSMFGCGKNNTTETVVSKELTEKLESSKKEIDLLKNEKSTIMSEIDKINKDLKLEKENNEALKKEINSLENLVKEQNIIMNNKDKNEFLEGKIILTIYTIDSFTYKTQVAFYKAFEPNDESLEGIKIKITEISNILSQNFFKDLPIEVEKIQEENGKNIVFINLKDNPSNSDVTWEKSFFQGSCGGSITSGTLIQSILQREYKGKWIDGVKFLYNGKDVNFEHVESLGKVIYK